MNEKDVRTAKTYLILKRGRFSFESPQIVGMRANKPALKGDQIAVRVKLKIDMSIFNEFLPEVEAEVENGNIITPDIELESIENEND